ncbi:acyl-CoA dehydrogenase family protein [Pseudomonas aeruginosa]
MPGAGLQGARRGRRGHLGKWPTPGSAAGRVIGRRQLCQPGPARPRPVAAPERPIASSSASRSAATGAFPFKLADMATQIRAAELMTLHTAWKMDQGHHDRRRGRQAMRCSPARPSARSPTSKLQIFGGMGLMDEGPVGRIWRNARIRTDLGGHFGNPAAHRFPRTAACRTAIEESWLPSSSGEREGTTMFRIENRHES